METLLNVLNGCGTSLTVQFKTQPNNNHVPRHKNEIPCRCTPPPGHTRVKVSLVARPLLAEAVQEPKWYIYEQNVCSFTKIISHRNAFFSVRQALGKAYPDKEVPNKATVHRQVTEKLHCLSSRRWLTSSASAVRMFLRSCYQVKTKQLVCLVTMMPTQTANNAVLPLF
jgi:hypothetical protein